MRCYFMRGDRIDAVELLTPGTDGELIEQAKRLFQKRASPEHTGFEVWELNRFVYRERRSDGGLGATPDS